MDRSDSAFGLRHWHDFSYIAVVTDDAWLRAVVDMFKPFFYAEVQLFPFADLRTAKKWISEAK